MGGHEHEFAQAAGIGVGAAKMQLLAEIGVPLFAQLAASAGLGRVDCDACAGQEGGEVAVVAVGADVDDDPRKFVSQGQRGGHHGIADAGILVRVDIAAADADRSDAQQRHSWAGCGWLWNLLDAQVAWAVQPHGLHGWGGHGRCGYLIHGSCGLAQAGGGWRWTFRVWPAANWWKRLAKSCRGATWLTRGVTSIAPLASQSMAGKKV